MSATRLLETCRTAGLSVELDGVNLIIEADCDPPPELLVALRQHKAELIVALSKRDHDGAAPVSIATSTADDAIGGAVMLRDGRRLHRFAAADIPQDLSRSTVALMDEARWRGAVLVADGHVLIVVEPWLSSISPDLLMDMKREAGAVIAALRGESRKRTEGVVDADPADEAP